LAVKDKEATREKIVRAAIKVFSDNGYHGATVDDIVAESGTSKGAFYFHFPNKEGMFTALVEEMAGKLWGAVRKALKSPGNPGDKIARALYAGLETFQHNRELARIALVETAALGPELEEKRGKVRLAFLQLIEEHLRELVEEGTLERLDTRVAALALLGTIDEVVVHWLATGEPDPLVKAAPALVRYNLQAIGLNLPGRGKSC